MEPWKTAITHSYENHIWVRGKDITSLMTNATFTDLVFLLYQGRLPSPEERRLLDAILIGVADHGPGSPSAAASRLVATGNRQAPEAAIAAGILAIGDAHAGAGLACMEIIKDGLDLARRESLTIPDAAGRTVDLFLERKERLPGFGHRHHTSDPRTPILFKMASEFKLRKDGIEFMEALEAAVQKKIKPLPINIDGALAAVLHDMGFPPLFGKVMFIVGRVAGLGAQVMEEYTREKPMRIRIPVEYDGPPPEIKD
jgi:citrate synthase